MSRNMRKFFSVFLVYFLASGGIPAQAIRDNAASAETPLPPVKISIFSSGLAYYEHSGTLNGPAVIILPFKTGTVNDALKSLVLNDPASTNPFVSYQSEQTLLQTLRSLAIDLSDNPVTAVMLGRLRGAEVEIARAPKGAQAPGGQPSPVSGRIVGVEYRMRVSPTGDHISEPKLSLYTEQGIQLFDLDEINSLNFKDPKTGDDLKRALDLIALSRNSDLRDLTVHLPGNGSRRVSLSYVIPAPVWKVSYRLDMGAGGGEKPLFQGWAIVDNDGDSDWKDVELSLVAGRPASFIQNLYPPYYTFRQILPLSIAGAASGTSHDTAYAMPSGPAGVDGNVPPAARARAAPQYAPEPAVEMMAAEMDYMREEAESGRAMGGYAGLSGGTVETAAGAAAGDQFEFTVKHPVSLDRRMSAMLPLVEARIDARKVLVFSGTNVAGRNYNPRLGAELTNTSGMKLPAGPITVYDGGTYAGDALIEFWNEGEKRLISYGEDLSVTAAVTASNTRNMVSVKVSQGVMTLNRSQEYTRLYTFKNNAAQAKSLIAEHPKTQNAVLESPQADEQTPAFYRFNVNLQPEKETVLEVRETRPLVETVRLLGIRPEVFLSYTSNQEIPQNVRNALQEAVNLRTAVSAAETEVNRAERQRTFLLAEQDRIRKNIEAAGASSEQGQEYLKRLLSLDNDIDNMTPEMERLNGTVENARKAFEDYVNALEL